MSVGGEPGPNVPVWQPDEEALSCPLCENKFSLFYRRHHCRMCGRVVCGSCSDNSCSYLATSYVVSPPHQIFLESPHVPHRTCDECFEELRMIRAAIQPAPTETRELMIQNVNPAADELNRCPVCDRLLVRLPQSEQESHVDECLQQFSSSPGARSRRNRMILSRLPLKESQTLGECPVCYEDFKPGDAIGRLECLCVFHEKCILEWFARKGVGSCPIHEE